MNAVSSTRRHVALGVGPEGGGHLLALVYAVRRSGQRSRYYLNVLVQRNATKPDDLIHQSL